ncbi:MAG TPA: response regulator [Kofleriaceae bacterium]|nr:response regulator [Kofleriaceae bacterium]
MSKAEKRTILVVDDDPEIVLLLQTRLEKRGYRTLIAADGHQAVEIAKRERPDAMLLDVMMPGKSGWEVARALKQDPVTAAIKIVIVSAIGPTVTDATSSLYGADAHIDKPFEFAKLDQIVDGLFV